MAGNAEIDARLRDAGQILTSCAGLSTGRLRYGHRGWAGGAADGGGRPEVTAGLCQPRIAMLLPHDTYIETHPGGGAIMKRRPPELGDTGVDPDAGALEALSCDDPVEPGRVPWARFAGEEYTDRPRIQRKAESRARRFGPLFLSERLAVLATMMAVGARWMEASSRWRPGAADLHPECVVRSQTPWKLRCSLILIVALHERLVRKTRELASRTGKRTPSWARTPIGSVNGSAAGPRGSPPRLRSCAAAREKATGPLCGRRVDRMSRPPDPPGLAWPTAPETGNRPGRRTGQDTV